MKKFKKIYIEITNICNLSCSFCPGTKREKEFMPKDRFETILDKIKPFTDYIYLHLMGEPLLHPNLEEMIDLANKKGFHVCITTNGTLLSKIKLQDIHKLSISLQAQEANNLNLNEYLDSCFTYGKDHQDEQILVYRLWNHGGKEENNEVIIKKLKEYYPNVWEENRQGYKLTDKTFLEFGDTFIWPGEINQSEETTFCYGLNDQIGVLVDGTIVPCCLDCEGRLALGNILNENLDTILSSKKAVNIIEGFKKKIAVEPMCKSCDFARRFK